jgi:hypothetical protein
LRRGGATGGNSAVASAKVRREGSVKTRLTKPASRESVVSASIQLRQRFESFWKGFLRRKRSVKIRLNQVCPKRFIDCSSVIACSMSLTSPKPS